MLFVSLKMLDVKMLAFKDGAYFCYCAYALLVSRYLGFLLIQGYFCTVQNYAEKAELSKGSWCPKRKLGVTMHFSEISQKLQFGEKHHIF